MSEVEVVEVHTTVYMLEPVKKLLVILAHDEDTTKKMVINKAIIEYAKKKLNNLKKEYLKPAIEERIAEAEKLLKALEGER